MVLKQNGAELTGTAGPRPDRQHMTVANGKVTTVKGVTTVTFDATGGDGKVHFDLKLTDGRLKGTAKADVNGQTREAVVDVGRAKEHPREREP